METWKLKLAGTWNDTKGKIKKEYAHLTDDDLLYNEGDADQLLGKLQSKIGKTKQEIKDWIENL